MEAISDVLTTDRERPLRAATLAVGTEVTDGQILDRNSAWLSRKLVDAGIAVIEHRAVADDRSDITRALSDLASRVDLLFVTGGLGPTSDDFTRDLIAEVFARPLEFDPGSWEHIQRQLGQRGIVAREIQKQQCYFPKGARVLTNMAGTANAFTFVTENDLQLYALPGPPSEIAAVWEMHLARDIEARTPESAREKLRIIRCLGIGESSVAEIVEEIIAGTGLRVGYRAHLPYIETKIWYRQSDAERAHPVLARLESALAQWFVNRDGEDAADAVIDSALRGSVRVRDGATRGGFGERVIQRAKERGVLDQMVDLQIATNLNAAAPPGVGAVQPDGHGAWLEIQIQAHPAAGSWEISLRAPAKGPSVLAEKPPFNYHVLSERGCKFITEKAFFAVADFLKVP